MNRDRPKDLSYRSFIVALAATAFSLPSLLAAGIKARFEGHVRPWRSAPNRRHRGNPKSNVDLGCYPKKPHNREWTGKGKTRRLERVALQEPCVRVRRIAGQRVSWTEYTPLDFEAIRFSHFGSGTVIEHVDSLGQVRERVRIS